MTTARQVLANRANARRSTGPKTLSARARSSANARRHGLSTAFDLHAAAVIELAASLFPGLTFDFGTAGPDAVQGAALRLAAAELRVQAIRARQGDIDARINAVMGRADFPGTARARGMEALLDRIGLTQNPDRQVVAALRRMLDMNITGNPALLDPLTQALREQKLLKRYRREAEAQRRAALLAMPQFPAAEPCAAAVLSG